MTGTKLVQRIAICVSLVVGAACVAGGANSDKGKWP